MHRLPLSLLAFLTLTACQSIPLGGLGFEREREVPLAEVPGVVLAAARAAVPGIELQEAELETKDGRRIYELEGTRNGEEFEIELTEDGEVLEIEPEPGGESGK